MTFTISPLDLPTSSRSGEAFDLDVSRSYQEVWSGPDGTPAGYIDQTVFVQGEKIAVIYFSALSQQDVPYSLYLAKEVSQDMTP